MTRSFIVTLMMSLACQIFFKAEGAEQNSALNFLLRLPSVLLYSAFWKVNKSSGEAERPEARRYYLCQLIYGCKWKKMCNLRNARRNWRCFPKGREHSSIILQTRALIIEEGNAAETFLALHIRYLFKRKLGRILFKQRTQTKHCDIFFQLRWQLSQQPSALISRHARLPVWSQSTNVEFRCAQRGPFQDATVHVSKRDAPVFICACLDFF